MTREQRICAECGKDNPECAYYTYFTLENIMFEDVEKDNMECITNHVFNDFWMVDKWGNPLK